jgi:microcystin degradation protein MlrC
MVQPWLDAPWLGWTLYQAWTGDAPPFDASEIADACWQTRHHREIDYVSAASLLDAAHGVDGGPVAISEGHDATNSGAPGDSTVLMAALIAQEIGEGGGLCFCVDPRAVALCTAAGVGARLTEAIGGRSDPFSEPLSVEGTVEAVGDLRYTLSGHGGHNLPVDMGRMARLRVRDTTIVLVERTGPGSSPMLYEAAGVDPRSVKVVLAKSPEGFRADYEPFAAGILYAEAPGCAPPFIDRVELSTASHPVFPWDDMAEPTTATWAGAVYERGPR